MLFGLFSSKQEKPNNESFLRTLWLSHRIDWVLGIIAQMTEKDENIPVDFLSVLTENNCTQYTSYIIRELLVTYHQPKWNVCMKVANMLADDSRIGLACAHAIGTEKCATSKNFYHKIRTIKKMEIAQWRKYLSSIRLLAEGSIKLVPKTIPYTLGLFNEPLPKTVSNPSNDNDIISVYKSTVYRNKILRTPIELSLEIPLTLRDLHFFAEAMTDEQIVIITKHIGENVVPPKGFNIVFTDSTKSFGPGIYPYFEAATINFFDML